jgi:hypothetical protein
MHITEVVIMNAFAHNNAIVEARDTAKHRRAVKRALKANPGYVSINLGANRHERRRDAAVARATYKRIRFVS